MKNIMVSVFRFKQSLDEPGLLIWRPFSLRKGNEWPCVFFLRMVEGKLEVANDCGLPIKLNKIKYCTINVMDLF